MNRVSMAACAASAILAATFVFIENVGADVEADVGSNVLAEFPFDSYSGILVVPVTFNGVVYKFVIDTGAANTSFEPELSFLLTKNPHDVQLTDANRTVMATSYSAPPGKIGSITLPRLPMVCCYNHLSNRVLPVKAQGHLGMDAMRNCIMHIDYDRGTISFLRSVPATTSVRLPLNNRRICPAVKGTVDGATQTFVLDTGGIFHGAGFLTKRQFDKMAAAASLLPVGKLPLGSDFGIGIRRAGVATGPVCLAGNCHVGLVFSELQNSDCVDNLLGAGYLRRYVVTFNFPERAVYFAPGVGFRQIDASYDSGGFRLRRDGERIVVSSVAWRCPASDAGIRTNDVLLAIDGVHSSSINDVGIAGILSNGERPTSFVFRSKDNITTNFTHDEPNARTNAIRRFNAQGRRAPKSIKP